MNPEQMTREQLIEEIARLEAKCAQAEFAARLNRDTLKTALRAIRNYERVLNLHAAPESMQ